MFSQQFHGFAQAEFGDAVTPEAHKRDAMTSTPLERFALGYSSEQITGMRGEGKI
jgi:hypothetical protein